MNRIKSYYSEILIFLSLIILSLILTYPLIFRMGSSFSGYHGDPMGAIYSLWRMKDTWAKGIPYHFNALVASPFGVEYVGNIRVPLLELFAKWLTILTNEIFAYNFIILLSFPLAGITMYYLVYYFTKNKMAGFLSGVIFTFSPYHFVHSWAHLGLSDIQWMPLYVLTLFRLDKNRTYVNAFLCAAAFFWLNAFSDPHYGYFMAVFTVSFLLFKLLYGWRHYRWPVADPRSAFRGVKVGLAAAGIALIIILPFRYRALKTAFFEPKTEAVAAQGYVRPFKDLFYRSAKPLNYLLPAVEHPVFGRYTTRFLGSIFYGRSSSEHTLYLGYVSLILAAVAVRNWRRRRKGSTDPRGGEPLSHQPAVGTGNDFVVGFFIFAALIAVLFSQSPYWQIGPFRIPFPSYFMYKIIPMVRVYARFGIVVMLSVAVLAGIGVADILKKMKNGKWRIVFSGLVIMLVLFEFWNWPPYRVTDVSKTPPVYEWLAEQPGDFTIVEYPLKNDYEYLFWQRIHRKPLVNGAMPGTYAEKVRKVIVNITGSKTPGVLRWLGAKYVIFHPDKYLNEEEATTVIGAVPDLSKVTGLRFVREFEGVQVYEVVAEAVEPVVR